MLKAVKSSVVLAMLLGALVGCSSNKSAAPVEPVVEPDPEPVYTPDPVPAVEVDPMDSVDTVFYFEFDSAILNSAARSALLLHAEDLKSSGQSVRLEGHADERGSREYNMALGERRANAVRDFLTLQGVSFSQLETISYGEESPVSIGGYESAWSQNRRVELK